MKRDLNELVAEYVEKAKIHAEADDNEIGNAAAKRLIELRELLKHNGWLDQLIPLMDSSIPSVRLWAASDCFDIKPQKAKDTLIELSNFPGSLGFSAEMTLKEALKANLKRN